MAQKISGVKAFFGKAANRNSTKSVGVNIILRDLGWAGGKN